MTSGRRPGETDLDALQRRLADLEADRNRWRRSTRRAQLVALVALLAVLVLAPSVGWLARSLDQRNQAVSDLGVLVERQECTDESEARFEDALTEVVAAAIDGDDRRIRDAGETLEGLGAQEAAIAECERRFPG